MKNMVNLLKIMVSVVLVGHSVSYGDMRVLRISEDNKVFVPVSDGQHALWSAVLQNGDKGCAQEIVNCFPKKGKSEVILDGAGLTGSSVLRCKFSNGAEVEFSLLSSK